DVCSSDLLTTGVNGRQRIAVYGTGDVAELVFLLLREMGLELVAVFDETPGRFLGIPVRAIEEHPSESFDALVVAVLEQPAAARTRLLAAGVPPQKLVSLEFNMPATPVAETHA